MKVTLCYRNNMLQKQYVQQNVFNKLIGRPVNSGYIKLT